MNRTNTARGVTSLWSALTTAPTRHEIAPGVHAWAVGERAATPLTTLGDAIDTQMPSSAFNRWNTTARQRLDEIVQAHQAVGGTRPGRRAATLQINRAYAVLLSSHFQGFCRDLHTEATAHVCAQLADPWARPLVSSRLADNRKLDSGNPNPGNIGSDFGRFGFDLWAAMRSKDPLSKSRQRQLETLNAWRNSIAHQDFRRTSDLDLGGGRLVLRLSDVTKWRRSVERLAITLDMVVGHRVAALAGTAPW